jgi:hypothetical protein
MNVFSRQSGLFALALLLVGSLIAAKFPAATKQYDYVTVVQQYNDMRVTTGPTKFEASTSKQEGDKNYYNFTPALKKVEELEAQGYEIVTNEFQVVGAYPTNYFLLRRPK